MPGPTGKEAAMRIRQLEQQVAQLGKENGDLQEQVVKKKKGRKGLQPGIPLNKEMAELIDKKVGSELWRTCKFLASEPQLTRATWLVMKMIPEANALLPPNSDINDAETQAIAENFKYTYGGTITKKLNNRRNSAQSGIQAAYVKRALKGKFLPTPQQLLHVVKRKGLGNPSSMKKTDPRYTSDDDLKLNWDIFEFYWDELLPKVAGKQNWGKNMRHYGLISTMTFPNDKTKKYVTSSDEALVVLLVENMGQRLPYVAQCKSTTPVTPVDKEHKLYASKYTSSNEGQICWGGWDCPGRARFIELTKAIKVAKTRGHVRQVEEEMLSRLQQANGLHRGAQPNKDKAEPEIFESNTMYQADFGVESCDESELGTDSDCDEFEENYRKVEKKAATKKSKKKRGSLSKPVYQDGSSPAPKPMPRKQARTDDVSSPSGSQGSP